MNIEVHIEEVVLHGFSPGDRSRIAEALQSSLSGLLIESGVPPALTHGGAVDRIEAPSFTMETAVRPETTGRQIAQAVYGEWSAWANE
ncbi:hypothetical protein [Candidatus Nitrospira bockiana]